LKGKRKKNSPCSEMGGGSCRDEERIRGLIGEDKNEATIAHYLKGGKGQRDLLTKKNLDLRQQGMG